jgi:hypothetical protein
MLAFEERLDAVDGPLDEVRAFLDQLRDRFSKRIDDQEQGREDQRREDEGNAETGHAGFAETIRDQPEDQADDDGERDGDQDQRHVMDEREEHDRENADHRPGHRDVQRLAPKRQVLHHVDLFRVQQRLLALGRHLRQVFLQLAIAARAHVFRVQRSP